MTEHTSTFMSIESVTLSNHLILCCPLLLPTFWLGFSFFLVLSYMSCLYILKINSLLVVLFSVSNLVQVSWKLEHFVVHYTWCLELYLSVVAQSCPTLRPRGLYSPHYAPLSMGFSRQEYWSGLPFPSPGDLPDPGIEPRSPALQTDALTSEPPIRHQNCCFYLPSSILKWLHKNSPILMFFLNARWYDSCHSII